MGISPYLRRLRERIGHELVLLPSVAVLAWDDTGRLLLVREAETGMWQTVGGAVEPDESPAEAAVREAREETGVTVELQRIRCVAGGPQFRMTYRNGDQVNYVPTVYDARVVSGTLRPDGEETLDVAWFSALELGAAQLTPFTHALFAFADVPLRS
jgi:8-oxo-dGTP pyrophosphatase MutT (NUDIX family)